MIIAFNGRFHSEPPQGPGRECKRDVSTVGLKTLMRTTRTTSRGALWAYPETCHCGLVHSSGVAKQIEPDR